MSSEKIDKNTIALMTAMKARMPVMLVGAPGVGKTETFRSIAKKMGYSLKTLIGSQLDPTDLAGLPHGEVVGTREDGSPIMGTVNLAPAWQIFIMKHKKVILFLDEFSNTSSAVRASMLTMLQNREFPNGDVMPRETIIVGAMNPSSQAADGYELDLPTTNRILFIPWNPSINNWYEGMLNCWGHKVGSTNAYGHTVTEEEMKWRRKIVAFIRDNPSYLHKEPANVESTEVFGVNRKDESEMEVLRSSWASRRSWDHLAEVLGEETTGDAFVQDILMQGTIGYASSAKFRDWLIQNDDISPDEVIANPKDFDYASLEVDKSNALLRAVVDKVTDENLDNVIQIFLLMVKNKKGHLAGPFVKSFLDAATTKSANVKNIKENATKITKIIGKLSPYIKNS